MAKAIGWMVALLALDQGVKTWVRAELPLYRAHSLVPNLLDLTHVENQGVSFGFLENLGDGVRVPALMAVSLTAVGLLVYYWWRQRRHFSLWSHLAFVLILPGAAGNLIDRAVFGTVTDFLHFRFYGTSFFVNNIADILISSGVVAFLIGRFREGGPAAEKPPSGT